MKNGPGKFCLFAALIVTILLSSSRESAAQNQSWDTSFIPKETFLFVGFNVEGLIRLEEEDSELLKRLNTLFAKEVLFKFDELRQVQIMMGGDDANSDGDSLEIKMIFHRPQDWNALIDKLFGRMNVAESNGMKYFQSTCDSTSSVHIADNLTMVIAKEERLKKLMANESGKGPIVDTVSEADGNAHAFMAFEYNDQLATLMREATAELQGLPFDLVDIVAEAKNGTATVVFDADEPLIANIETRDADGADRLQLAAEAIVALGKIRVTQGRKIIRSFHDSGSEELRKHFFSSAEKGLDVAEVALDNATVNADGNKVEIKAKVKGGAGDGARSIADMFFYGVKLRYQAHMESFRDIADDIDEVRSK